MSHIDYEVKGYNVSYYTKSGEFKERPFIEEDCAVEFARDLANKGYEVTIEQVSVLVGWY